MARYPVVPEHAVVPSWWTWARAEYELSPETIVVFLALCTNAAPDRMVSVPSRTLAADTGLARSTVVKAIDALIKATMVVDLGQKDRRSPQRLRIAMSRPLPRQRLDLPTIADARLRSQARKAR